MDVEALAAQAEAGDVFLAVEDLAILLGGGGGEPAAVAAHDFVDDEHAGIGTVLGDYVLEIAGALLGGGPGAEGLTDGEYVVVDRLRQADDGEAVVVLRQIGGEVGGGGVGVVTTDGVEDVHAVLDELFGGDLLRVLAFLHETALHAVFHVGELHAAVADGAAAVAVQHMGIGTHFGRDLVAVAEQEAFIAAAVGDDFDVGRDLGVALDEATDGGAEAGGEATSREKCNFLGSDRSAHDKKSREFRQSKGSLSSRELVKK
ncbi:MAG: hypothetical protein BWX86_01059 [Verrucomicrobia bacterium ADurb.Bin122]|nr:MAG: hypothetical protein BWX86_01059 [Verrucomicrobia bacterium ADurb.Bin122]